MRHVTIRGLLQAAAVVTVTFSLVTLAPVDHHALQLFTHFRLQYLAASLLLLITFAFLRSPAYAAALLISVLASAVVVAPWYTDRPAQEGKTQIKLLHANVLATNLDHARLFTLINAEQPDLVFLQEISPQWEAALAALHGDYPHYYVEARHGNFGIALLSRLPLANVGHVENAPFGFPTLQGEFTVQNETVRFVSTHPMIPLGRENYAARNEQLRQVAEITAVPEDVSTVSTILVGDLNATMWDVNYRRFEAATGLRNVRRGQGILPTWPTFMPFAMIPIDHVFVSNDIGVEQVETGPRIGSDHLPLVVTLSL